MRTVTRWVSRVLLMVTSPLIVMARLVAADTAGGGSRAPTSSATTRSARIAIYHLPCARAIGQSALKPDPVLKWSNPIAGEVYGDVFVWTSKGRPEVVASLHKWYSPHTPQPCHRIPLALGGAAGRGTLETARRSGRRLVPRIEMKPIPGLPVPAAVPAQRLRQMRELAANFAGREKLYEETGCREMRLLSQPIYRYVKSEQPVVEQGGALRLGPGHRPGDVPADRGASGRREAAQWHGLARMNHVRCGVSYRERGGLGRTAPAVGAGHGSPRAVRDARSSKNRGDGRAV